MPLTGHLVVGPADHGVVLFAQALAAQDGGPVILNPGQARTDLVHLQFTDALYGRTCAEAAATFVRLAEELPGPVTVTLHDLPDPDDEPGRYQRRSAAYRAVTEAVDGVVVSSRHEARLLELLGARPAHAVIPLPVDPLDPADPHTAQTQNLERPEIGVLGFVHPGKGHREALTELAALGRPIDLTAIGRPADGHDDLITGLREQTEAAGYRWSITGFVPEAELGARLRRVTVPLAPGRLVSASGSVNTWLANGRRPLVLEGPYTKEIADRHPGTITLYRDGTLASTIRAALADPASTWLPPGHDIGPGRAETARHYARFFAAVTRRKVSA